MIFWQIFVESDEERAFYNQPVISLFKYNNYVEQKPIQPCVECLMRVNSVKLKIVVLYA